MEIKQQLLAEAGRVVNGPRRSAYGTPEANFIRIARFWQAYFENTGRRIEITAADVSPMMRLMKEARLCETPNHYDSHVDLIGYTLTGAEVNEVIDPGPMAYDARVGPPMTTARGGPFTLHNDVPDDRVTLGGWTHEEYVADREADRQAALQTRENRIGKPDGNHE